ncbi:DUF2218 domain-containing protein [Azospirillum griseum]|uniref:DUF2218 domain-containing protein n=1 Tax=Azospirillum griseum TaxID=2496639 RepID=A0A3S0KW52_9PROT|nr:DUF2218 domain-containing protein [Azospirillum griseum]RTR17198.1 DUF2218 domain-containing protein [Azospirillum griseum]
MAQSTTRVATTNAQRYLTQLCKHWGHKFAVTHGDGRGEIPFGEDRFCRLAADADGLDITVEAPADTLPRLQGVVFDHLKRFAFREELGEPVWTVSA